MPHTDPPQRKAIVPADNFPVTWAKPSDAELTWRRDTHHRPDPIPPLEADIFFQGRVGASRTAELLGSEPIYESASYCINGYLYGSRRLVAAQHDKEAIQQRSETSAEKAIEEMAQRWQQEWLPEIEAHLAFWDDFDLDAVSLPDLDAHLLATSARFTRLMAIHFAIVGPAYGAMRKLAEYYQELFADYDEKTDPFAAERLFQAMPNLTVEMGHVLWDMSRQALADPALSQLLRNPACTLETLQASAHGRDFAAALDHYLDQYGRRPPTWAFHLPTWREDPTPVLKNLREYLQANARDPRAERAKLAAERDQTIAETRAKLAGYPQQARDRFEHLLQLAQTGMILSEDHGVYIDFGATARVRYVLLACGRRLVQAGALHTAEDVLFLHYDEIRTALAANPIPSQQALVAKRRATFEHFSAITPPDRIGVEPPPKEEKEDDKKEQPPAEPNILRGNPCAPGIVRGPVRILRSMTATASVQPGEIMVATTTNPSWTPLFSTIAALGSVRK